MRGKSFIVLAVLFLCVCPALATIHFNDGHTHNIYYSISEDVYVDYQTPEMYTTANLLPGGRILHILVGYESSRINIRGGTIKEWLVSRDSSQTNVSSGTIDRLEGRDSSQVNVSGGSIYLIHSFHSSQVDISGGSIDYHLSTYDFSQVNISGGSMYSLVSNDSSDVNISGGSISRIYSSGFSKVDIFGGSIRVDLSLSHNSTIKIFGSDFAVDGQPFGYGELTSIFGGSWYNEPFRRLTGTLVSGELINNKFYIGDNAKIVLIPEPTTVLLLGIGGLALRRKRNRR